VFRNRLELLRGFAPPQQYPDAGFILRPIQPPLQLFFRSAPRAIARDSSSAHTFCRLLKTHCLEQALGSPYIATRLTQVPQIRPLADIVHSFTYLLTYVLKRLQGVEMRGDYVLTGDVTHWLQAQRAGGAVDRIPLAMSTLRDLP